MIYIPPKTIMELMGQQELSTDDIFSCMLSIRPLEIQTYQEVFMGADTVPEISDRIQRTNSTVQRILNQLMTYGLITRHSKSRGETGYYYTYQALPPEKVRDVLLDKLDTMYTKMRTYLTSDWLEHLNNQLKEKEKSRLVTL